MKCLKNKENYNAEEKFQNNVVGSRNRITDYVAVLSSAGDFSRVTNIQAILNSWNNILLTSTRTYVNNPEYGSNLYKYVIVNSIEFLEGNGNGSILQEEGRRQEKEAR